MAALYPEFEGNQLATAPEVCGSADSSSNSFIFMAVWTNPILRRLYGFCTKNEAKYPRNSFSERTLRVNPIP